MALKNIIRTGVLLVALLVVGIIPARPAAAYEQAVQPTTTTPGSVFAFFATGFAPEEWVRYWINDPHAGVLEGGEIRANHMGRADWTWKSPMDAVPGAWSMVAFGKTSQQERVIPFTIDTMARGPDMETPAGQEAYDAAVTPRAGAPGTEFDVFGRGFHEYERVVFWLTNPDGQEYQADAFGTNEYGRVDWTWESPANAQSGTWIIRMQGDKSQVERIVTLDIIPGPAFPEQAAPTDTYDSAVTPARGIPGTWFTFYIDNFIEYDTVAYQFIAPDGDIFKDGEVHASGRGRIDLELDMPSDAMPGIWSLVAQGRASALTRTVTFEVYIETDEETAVTMPGTQVYPYDRAVHPAEGGFGTEFSFYATGFGHEEPVDFDIIGPDGVVYHHASVRSNEWGRADWRWAATSIAIPGQWTTVATGRDSNVERTLHFTMP